MRAAEGPSVEIKDKRLEWVKGLHFTAPDGEKFAFEVEGEIAGDERPERLLKFSLDSEFIPGAVPQLLQDQTELASLSGSGNAPDFITLPYVQLGAAQTKDDEQAEGLSRLAASHGMKVQGIMRGVHPELGESEIFPYLYVDPVTAEIVEELLAIKNLDEKSTIKIGVAAIGDKIREFRQLGKSDEEIRKTLRFLAVNEMIETVIHQYPE